MDSLMPSSMNSVALRGPKPFSLCKWARHRPKPPKAIQCNYFTAHGNAAKRCPDYAARVSRLQTVATKMEQNEMRVSRLELNPRRPYISCLRRNILAGIANSKKAEQRLKRFVNRLEEEPAMVSTEKFARDASHRRHMAMYHGFDEAVENQLDASPQRQQQVEDFGGRSRVIENIENSYDHFRRSMSMDEEPCLSKDAYAKNRKSYERPQHPADKENRLVAVCRVDGTGPIVRSQKVIPRNDETTRSRKFADATRLFDMGDDSAIEEALNNSIHADYVDIRTRDGLMRSFYSVFLRHQAPPDPPSFRETKIARRNFANSALVQSYVRNPPINGLEFREYDESEYDTMDAFTKQALQNWSTCLNPALLPPQDDYESGWEEEECDALKNWNWCVRQAKRAPHAWHDRHRERAGSSGYSAIVEHPEDGIARNARRQTVYAESNGDVVMEEVTEVIRRTRRIKKSSGNNGHNNSVVIEPMDDSSESPQRPRSKIADYPMPKRTPVMDPSTLPSRTSTATATTASKRANPYVTPTPKRRGRPPKVRALDESANSQTFKSPPKTATSTPKPKPTPKTPQAIPLADSPSLRRTPRSVKAICYKE